MPLIFILRVELPILENRQKVLLLKYLPNSNWILIFKIVCLFSVKKRNAIKVLRYDHNGFILASKKLLDGMKFQWPRTPEEVKEVTHQQLKWLLDGLSIEQKKAHHEVKMSSQNSCY